MVYMRKHHPDFDEEIFEQEIGHIFEESYNAYLQHDLDKIEESCITEALGFFKALMLPQ